MATDEDTVNGADSGGGVMKLVRMKRRLGARQVQLGVQRSESRARRSDSGLLFLLKQQAQDGAAAASYRQLPAGGVAAATSRNYHLSIIL